MNIQLRALALTVTVLFLAGCTTSQMADSLGPRPDMMPELGTTKRLSALPAPQQEMTVAIYQFSDRTGQRKPNRNVAELSTAVTQGAAAILVDAAFRAGNGSWFKVLERNGLQNLLQERQIIRSTRDQFGDQRPLQALTFGGILLEGGIISYDTNVLTGGVGARLLGVGANAEYQADTVSVYLRAVSVKSGEVVESVNVTKTLYSAKLQANVFKFIAFEELLEIDAGISSNEPTQIAVRQAVEAAMYALIMEGYRRGIWSFADELAGEQAFNDYLELRKPFGRVDNKPADKSAS